MKCYCKYVKINRMLLKRQKLKVLNGQNEVNLFDGSVVFHLLPGLSNPRIFR